MTDLSGIELRKELCLAIGWIFRGQRWHQSDCPCTYGHDYSNPHLCKCRDCRPHKAALPKYESDATLFFGLLETVCKERSWYAEVHLDKEPRCKIWLSRVNIVTEHGATLTEAGCRCLLSALKADTRKEKS